jgi:glutathione synthase/RimK-type ligase-like ATP-grasp enzyme
MSRPTVALATCSKLPDLPPDEIRLIRALADRGIDARPAIWDDRAIDWKQFAAVIMRSVWDYHHRHREFLEWVSELELREVPVWNPPALIRWNSDKSYLKSLEAGGVRTVPTLWADSSNTTTLADMMDGAGWSDAVVKPTVSATAHDTFRVTRSEADAFEPRFISLRANAVMVQPTVKEILAEGEWSICFFGGQFSHAIVKRAKAGDFRVQEDFGGTSTLEAATPELVAQARSVLDAVPGPWLYARVDGCVVNEKFVLLELEMLEPTFFLDVVPAAAERFAIAIERVLPTR